MPEKASTIANLFQKIPFDIEEYAKRTFQFGCGLGFKIIMLIFYNGLFNPETGERVSIIMETQIVLHSTHRINSQSSILPTAYYSIFLAPNLDAHG